MLANRWQDLAFICLIISSPFTWPWLGLALACLVKSQTKVWLGWFNVLALSMGLLYYALLLVAAGFWTFEPNLELIPYLIGYTIMLGLSLGWLFTAFRCLLATVELVNQEREAC